MNALRHLPVWLFATTAALLARPKRLERAGVSRGHRTHRSPHQHLIPIMNRSLIIPTMFAALTLSLARLQAEIPQMIHYQGYVTVSGTAFTGVGTFKFALVDRPGTTTYWSHDGTSV